jgi:HD-GYP domain-containing protein (c-di-GMP phosphodiesterase class II)
MSEENNQAIEASSGYYFPVSPLMLFPHTRGDFGVYLKLNGRFVLYAHPDENFTEEHRKRLYQHGVEEIYILTNQRREYEKYVEANLGNFLLNDELPVRERSRVFYNASISIIKETFETRLPRAMDRERFDRIMKFVTTGTKFLLQKGSLKNVAALISHDYETYSHCVHVFVFSTAIWQTYDLEESQIFRLGLGAVLHDIGKTAIPKHILNKKGQLSKEERGEIKTHPLKGVGLCTMVPLSQDALNCILFHHEKMDGSGYPLGIQSADLPFAVKVVSAADVYAALTAERPYAGARSPFDALVMMRDEMPGHFDMRILRRLISVLSEAQVVLDHIK